MPPKPTLGERLASSLQRLGIAGTPESRRRRLLLALGTLLAVGVFLSRAIAAARRSKRSTVLPPLPIALSAVLRLLRESSVQEMKFSEGGELLLRMKSGRRFTSMLVPGSAETVFNLANEMEVPRVRYAPANRAVAQVGSYAMLFFMIFVWYKVAKSLISRDEKFTTRKGGRKSLREATTFADVICKSKIELSEIVDYLNHPEKYRSAGARLPRGTLLVGPSGTGKTLLARAVAGEARCAFLSASAAEFVEVYVGRGAARVRDLFRQARAMAPVVIFIDELDALGNRSGNSDGRAANEEYVQTLNQMLTELDGFHGHSDGIVVLAATNRREAVDSALLRPGRFDRHVCVSLPDEEERGQILRLHASRAPMAQALLMDANRPALEHVAELAKGLSGAELANIVNEAVFLAMRGGREEVWPQDLYDALERQLSAHRGSTRRSPRAAPNTAHPFFMNWAGMTTATATR